MLENYLWIRITLYNYFSKGYRNIDLWNLEKNVILEKRFKVQ